MQFVVLVEISKDGGLDWLKHWNPNCLQWAETRSTCLVQSTNLHKILKQLNDSETNESKKDTLYFYFYILSSVKAIYYFPCKLVIILLSPLFPMLVGGEIALDCTWSCPQSWCVRSRKMGKLKKLSEFDKSQIVTVRRLDQSLLWCGIRVGSDQETLWDVSCLQSGLFCKINLFYVLNHVIM